MIKTFAITVLLASLALLPTACRDCRGADPKGEAKHYQIEVKAPGAQKVGQASAVTVVLTPTQGYKVNKDYPHKLTWQPSSEVTLAPAAFTAKEAQMKETSLTFPSSIQASSPGARTITGVLQSSVCTEKMCDLIKETISFTFEVQ